MITKRATSILNGVVGDYLEASNNELALTMGFYKNDTLLDPKRIFYDTDDDDLTTLMTAVVTISSNGNVRENESVSEADALNR